LFLQYKYQQLIRELLEYIPNEEQFHLNKLLEDKKGGKLIASETSRIEKLDVWIDNLLTECKLYCKELPKHEELPPTHEYSILCSDTILKPLLVK
jgi:hypothetical protein